MSTTRHQRSCLRTAARAAAVSLCSCTIASGKSTSTPSSVHTYAARARASSTYAEYASASSDRWASKALAVRGGIEEVTGEDSPWGGIPGAMSERRITLSSFNRILGDKLLVVEDPSKGTIQEARAPVFKVAREIAADKSAEFSGIHRCWMIYCVQDFTSHTGGPCGISGNTIGTEVVMMSRSIQIARRVHVAPRGHSPCPAHLVQRITKCVIHLLWYVVTLRSATPSPRLFATLSSASVAYR